MFWETIDGYRFCPTDNLLEGSFKNWSGYQTQLSKTGLSMKKAMNGIISIEFQQIGNYQSLLKSGALRSTAVSFDIDTGNYKELLYTADVNLSTSTATQKQIRYSFTKSNLSYQDLGWYKVSQSLIYQ